MAMHDFQTRVKATGILASGQYFSPIAVWANIGGFGNWLKN